MAASRGDGLNLQAATDAELWIMPDQWSDDPADEEEGLLSTSLSGSVTRCVGDENRVQVEFMNYFDVPQDFSGQWWACAYLYGEPTYWGTFQIDGVITEPTLIERDYDEDGTFDGVECLLWTSTVGPANNAHLRNVCRPYCILSIK